MQGTELTLKQVFGMTNMNDHEGFRRFGVATVCISVPTYWLLVLISWREKLGPLKIPITNRYHTLLGKQGKVGAVRRSYKSKDRRHLKATQKNAIYASLQRRLTSMSSIQGGRGSISRNDQEVDDLGNGKDPVTGSGPAPRRATVQFEETLQRPSRHGTAITTEFSPTSSGVNVAGSVQRSDRAPNLQESTDRNGDVPRRSSLLQKFASGSSTTKPTLSPV